LRGSFWHCSVPCCLLVFFVGDGDDGAEAAPYIEIADNGQIARIEEFHQVGQNAIGDFFIKRADIAERVEIKFERFEFDADFVGDIVHRDCCKVGLSGFRANGGKFRRGMDNTVISLRVGIGKSFE